VRDSRHRHPFVGPDTFNTCAAALSCLPPMACRHGPISLYSPPSPMPGKHAPLSIIVDGATARIAAIAVARVAQGFGGTRPPHSYPPHETAPEDLTRRPSDARAVGPDRLMPVAGVAHRRSPSGESAWYAVCPRPQLDNACELGTFMRTPTSVRRSERGRVIADEDDARSMTATLACIVPASAEAPNAHTPHHRTDLPDVDPRRTIAWVARVSRRGRRLVGRRERFVTTAASRARTLGTIAACLFAGNKYGDATTTSRRGQDHHRQDRRGRPSRERFWIRGLSGVEDDRPPALEARRPSPVAGRRP